jgi:hypothetical protein
LRLRADLRTRRRGHYAWAREDHVRAIENFSGAQIDSEAGVDIALAPVAGDVAGFERAQSKAVRLKILKPKPALVVADGGA